MSLFDNKSDKVTKRDEKLSSIREWKRKEKEKEVRRKKEHRDKEKDLRDVLGNIDQLSSEQLSKLIKDIGASSFKDYEWNSHLKKWVRKKEEEDVVPSSDTEESTKKLKKKKKKEKDRIIEDKMREVLGTLEIGEDPSFITYSPYKNEMDKRDKEMKRVRKEKREKIKVINSTWNGGSIRLYGPRGGTIGSFDGVSKNIISKNEERKNKSKALGDEFNKNKDEISNPTSHTNQIPSSQKLIIEKGFFFYKNPAITNFNSVSCEAWMDAIFFISSLITKLENLKENINNGNYPLFSEDDEFIINNQRIEPFDDKIVKKGWIFDEPPISSYVFKELNSQINILSYGFLVRECSKMLISDINSLIPDINLIVSISTNETQQHRIENTNIYSSLIITAYNEEQERFLYQNELSVNGINSYELYGNLILKLNEMESYIKIYYNSILNKITPDFIYTGRRIDFVRNKISNDEIKVKEIKTKSKVLKQVYESLDVIEEEIIGDNKISQESNLPVFNFINNTITDPPCYVRDWDSLVDAVTPIIDALYTTTPGKEVEGLLFMFDLTVGEEGRILISKICNLFSLDDEYNFSRGVEVSITKFLQLYRVSSHFRIYGGKLKPIYECYPLLNVLGLFIDNFGKWEHSIDSGQRLFYLDTVEFLHSQMTSNISGVKLYLMFYFFILSYYSRYLFIKNSLSKIIEFQASFFLTKDYSYDIFSEEVIEEDCKWIIANFNFPENYTGRYVHFLYFDNEGTDMKYFPKIEERKIEYKYYKLNDKLGRRLLGKMYLKLPPLNHIGDENHINILDLFGINNRNIFYENWLKFLPKNTTYIYNDDVIERIKKIPLVKYIEREFMNVKNVYIVRNMLLTLYFIYETIDFYQGCKRIFFELHIFQSLYKRYKDKTNRQSFFYLFNGINVMGIKNNVLYNIRNLNIYQVEHEINRIKWELGYSLGMYVILYITYKGEISEKEDEGEHKKSKLYNLSTESNQFTNENEGRRIFIPMYRLDDFFLTRLSPVENTREFFEEYRKLTNSEDLFHFEPSQIARIELDFQRLRLDTECFIHGYYLPIKLKDDDRNFTNNILLNACSKLQIHHILTEDNEYGLSCFINALIYSSNILTKKEIYLLKLKYGKTYITEDDINNICSSLKIQIRVDKMMYSGTFFTNVVDHSHTFNPCDYGKGVRLINIGLIRYGVFQHFFPIFKCKISQYCTKMLDLFDINNYNIKGKGHSIIKGGKIVKANGLEFIKDNEDINSASWCDSYQLLKGLIEQEKIEWLSNRENEIINWNREVLPVSLESIKEYYEEQTETISMNSNEKKSWTKLSYEEQKMQEIPYLAVADTETYTVEDEFGNKTLIPFCICLRCEYKNKDNIIKKTFYGTKCQDDFLDFCYDEEIYRIYFHNLKFDGWLFKDFMIRDMVYHGGRLYSMSILMYPDGDKKFIVLKDSLALISVPLRKFPTMFNLESLEKELYPYNIINKLAVETNKISIDECKNEFNTQDYDKFITMCKEKQFIKGNEIDLMKLTEYYCGRDVDVLYEGLKKFEQFTRQLFKGVNGLKFLTISGMSYFVMKQNCFIGLPEYKGDIKQYIRNSIRGGRCMVSNNEKKIVNETIVDFDACSLYPSAMNRLYLPTGRVYCSTDENEIKELFNKKLMKEEQIEPNERDVSYMIIHFKVEDIGIKRSFPLLSYFQDGISNYSNDVIGREFYMTSIEVEDFINYQKGKVKFIDCIYWKGQKDCRMSKYIKECYDLRRKYKAEGNPLQEVLKLFMNSSYGKTIQKDPKEEDRFLSKKKADTFMLHNCGRIKQILEVNTDTYWIKTVGCDSPLTIPIQIGSLILGMSKRIMNEVICTAEDNKIEVYYQDTDSIHIRKDDVEKLSIKFKERFQRDLIGSNLGQFHIDFPLVNGEEPTSRRSIFLGKKCYLDCLVNSKGDEEAFIRMKGIPEDVIRNRAKKEKITVEELYESLYHGTEYDFNLLESSKPMFEFNQALGIGIRNHFSRKISFTK